MNARRLASDVLVRARASKVFVDEVLEERCPSEMSPQDRGLVMASVYGVVRRRRTLDYLLASLSGRPSDKIEPKVAAALHVAMYQLLYMDRVPEYAACHEAVEIAKSVSAASGGFVNALLRALLRKIEVRVARINGASERMLETGRKRAVLFREPWLKPSDPVTRLGVIHSYPDSLVRRWLARFGEKQALQLLRQGNQPPVLTLRVNLRQVTRLQLIAHLRRDGLKAKSGRLPCSVIVEEGAAFSSLPSFKAGEFQPQDETSMRVAIDCGFRDGERALDFCAAPGAKSTHLAELAPHSDVIACDVVEGKTDLIRKLAARLGHERIRVLAADARRPPFRPEFDLVLVDAPCSNTGVLSRRPDARWRAEDAEIRKLQSLQCEILRAAIRCLKPGGRIVYATCSIEQEENEHVVQKVLQGSPHLRMEDSKVYLPDRVAGGGFFSRILWPIP